VPLDESRNYRSCALCFKGNRCINRFLLRRTLFYQGRPGFQAPHVMAPAANLCLHPRTIPTVRCC